MSLQYLPDVNQIYYNVQSQIVCKFDYIHHFRSVSLYYNKKNFTFAILRTESGTDWHNSWLSATLLAQRRRRKVQRAATGD